jgi:hypothetical protein
VILAYIIISCIRDYFPIESYVFWLVSAAVVGLAYLTYWYWMKSVLDPEQKSNRLWAYFYILAGLLLPPALYFSNIDILQPAVNADVFYICAVLTWFLYGSFVINKRLAQRKTR